MRIWLKYGLGNEVDEWWSYGVEFMDMAGIKGPVEYITDLDGKVVFEWWAFREKENEEFIDESHVNAYLMEVVVGIEDTSTKTVYELHYMHEIHNSLGSGPEDTETEVYLYEEGVMPVYKWQHYIHDITYDFYNSFKKTPSVQYQVVDVHLLTCWNGVSCGSSGNECPTAGMDFDDLTFTKVYGISNTPINFAYATTGCENLQSLTANYTAEVSVGDKIVSLETDQQSFPSPKSDLWINAWDVTVPFPEDADLNYGEDYSSAKITLTVDLLAEHSEGMTSSASATIVLTIGDVRWYGLIVPTENTKVSIEAV
jgi:hypothetical protein